MACKTLIFLTLHCLSPSQPSSERALSLSPFLRMLAMMLAAVSQDISSIRLSRLCRLLIELTGQKQSETMGNMFSCSSSTLVDGESQSQWFSEGVLSRSVEESSGMELGACGL